MKLTNTIDRLSFINQRIPMRWFDIMINEGYARSEQLRTFVWNDTKWRIDNEISD